MTQGSNRFVVLDSWRGIAALFVAGFHFTTIWALDVGSFVGHGWIFVDFFFVLSGFVIAHSCGTRLSTIADILDFMLRRIGRLWPLHIALLCLLAGLQMVKYVLMPGAEPGDLGHGILGFVSAALFLHSTPVWPFISLNGPSWSISAEFWSYLFFAGMVCFARRQRLQITMFTAWVGAFVLLVSGPMRLETYAEFAVVRCLYGFLAGALTFEFWRRHRDRTMLSGRFADAIEISAVMLTVLFVAFYADTAFQFLAPLVFAVAIFVFAGERGVVSVLLRSAPFVVIGDLSYSIYMTHSFLREIIRAGMQVMGYSATPSVGITWLLFVTFVLATLCLSTMTRRWIEKPGQRLFSAIADRVRIRYAPPAPAR